MQYIAALYMRLSKEDEENKESKSIETQRKILRSYSEEHNFIIYKEYADDGFSGTNFERPAFLELLKDIEKRKVNVVLTKDLSRLGRDYLATGKLIEEYFPKNRIRYIAVNDGYDSENRFNDIAPFRNVINEMYARDTSKKIRSAFSAKMSAGEFIGATAAYGYVKSDEDKHKLAIDKNTAPTVKRIFSLILSGKTPSEVARLLNDEKIPSPLSYKKGYFTNEWRAGVIIKMLKNPVYKGDMVQGKTSKISFKSKVTVSNSQENWTVVKNTHEALVSEKNFNETQKKLKKRAYKKNNYNYNIFSSIAKCADCKENMSLSTSRKKGSEGNLVCKSYKLYGKEKCSNHCIDYTVLKGIVNEKLRTRLLISENEKKTLSERLLKEMLKKSSQKQKELQAMIKIKNTLDTVLESLYTDKIRGVISKERYDKLYNKFENEYNEAESKIALIKNSATMESDREALRKRINTKIEEFIKLFEINENLLFRFVDKIFISQGEYKKRPYGKRQTVRICYRFKI